MENKKEIVKRLELLLAVTRAGSEIDKLILSDNEETITLQFKDGRDRNVCVAGDSGIEIIRDVVKKL